MAIGFIPKEKAEYSIEGVPESNVIAALLHLLHQGQWHVELEGERFLVGDRSSAMSAGHTLELQWDEYYLSVVCKLNGNFTDFGTSKKVLEKFLDDFKLALENLSEHEVQHWYSQYISVLENFRNDTGENQFKWWHIFIPGKGAIVTPVIFWINTLVFLVMQFGNLNEVFILLGANSFDTLNGQWWRLFTCMFLHGGFMHYAMNSFSLMILGFALERIIRAGIFSVIYLLSGIAAGVTSLWWHSYMSSVGASGAIFGLMGTLLALQLTSILTDESGKSRIGNTVLIIGLNLLYGLNEGIDNAAHIGGLICGLVTGLVLSYSVKKRASTGKRYLSLIIPAILLAGFSAWVLPPTKEMAVRRENAIEQSRQVIQNYLIKEKELIKDLDLLADTSVDVRNRYSFAESRRQGYEDLLRSLNSISRKDLPNFYLENLVLLQSYTENRIRYYETYKALFSPGGENNQQELKKIEAQRDSLLNVLKSDQ